MKETQELLKDSRRQCMGARAFISSDAQRYYKSGKRVLPSIYRWRMRLQITRWYRALLALEDDLTTDITPEKREELLRRLDHIEQTANKRKMPASFADPFYALRGHIGFVRQRLMSIGN